MPSLLLAAATERHHDMMCHTRCYSLPYCLCCLCCHCSVHAPTFAPEMTKLLRLCSRWSVSLDAINLFCNSVIASITRPTSSTQDCIRVPKTARTHPGLHRRTQDCMDLPKTAQTYPRLHRRPPTCGRTEHENYPILCRHTHDLRKTPQTYP